MTLHQHVLFHLLEHELVTVPTVVFFGTGEVIRAGEWDVSALIRKLIRIKRERGGLP